MYVHVRRWKLAQEWGWSDRVHVRAPMVFVSVQDSCLSFCFVFYGTNVVFQRRLEMGKEAQDTWSACMSKRNEMKSVG